MPRNSVLNAIEISCYMENTAAIPMSLSVSYVMIKHVKNVKRKDVFA